MTTEAVDEDVAIVDFFVVCDGCELDDRKSAAPRNPDFGINDFGVNSCIRTCRTISTGSRGVGTKWGEYYST